MGYGFHIPGSPNNPAKYNPQPTFIVPLSTPVRSIVDGVVANIPTLWSKDYSIQITKDGKMQRWIYEIEHVVNPKGSPEGFGAVEIGILKGGSSPEHVCPFAYLDDSIKEETLKKINALFKSWEEYIGDQTLYEETSIPGCLTLVPIEG